ncbi:MAG: D-alanyl-D-alanine carboxypeptidase family protein [Oscillospiraceae bacterium]|nr:D-alanyl-D-alanine carboxypeptidase family protein [Oscillospiraceae bacterium]
MRSRLFTVSLVCLLAAVLGGCSYLLPTPSLTPPVQTTPPAATIPPTTVSPTTHPPVTTLPPAPKIGWIEEAGKKYFYDENGVMLTGWQEIDEQLYYFKESGVMATGKVEIDGQSRYFGSDGSEVLLVNPWNFLPEDYDPEIVTINGWQYSNAICYDALMEMLQACKNAGLQPYIASAYRTHGDQTWLYNNKIQRLIAEGYSEADARKLAGTVVAVPGTSEHELGLAFDLVDDSYRNLDEAQENTPVQKWLMENSWKYGFILRYPSSKSEATGIIYEPWHYRYLGKSLAKEVYDSGLCLEEYLDSLTDE